MSLVDRIRRLVTGSSEQALVGPDLADVERVREALRREVTRRGKREGLTMTVFMEYSDLEFRDIAVYKIVAHLEAEGELANVVQPSDGNLRFDATDRLFD